MLRAYCLERSWEIYDIYIDDGFSGIDRSRPAFCRLIRDCAQGKINIVLCKDQSRFSRDTVIIEEYLNDKFLEWDIRFIGLADHADTENESYSTIRLFTSAYNEMYVKDISAKIRRTLAYKREQGQFIGSFAPYGYRIDPEHKRHLVIDTEAAPVVRQIFAHYVSGEGYRQIVQQLNALGIPSPSAYKKQIGSNYINCNAEHSSTRGLWTQSTVAKILSNEMYTGTLVQGKSHHISYKNKKRKQVDPADWVRIPDAHEAIIDAETWQNAQARLRSHTRVEKRSQILPPLSGKVYCAVCGSPMKRNVYYNKSKTIQYYGLQCASYKTGAMNCPNTKSISGKRLEQLLLDALNEIVSQDCQADEICIAELFTEQLCSLKRSLSKYREQHDSAQKRLLQMYKDKLDGVISAEEYALFRDELTAEVQAAAERIDAHNQQIAECLSQMQQPQTALLAGLLPFERLDRSLADEFLDKIAIGQTDEAGVRALQIYWNI